MTLAFSVGSCGSYVPPVKEFGGFLKLGVPFWGHNKDYSILGSIAGSPYFGKPPYCMSSAQQLEKTKKKTKKKTAWGFPIRHLIPI